MNQQFLRLFADPTPALQLKFRKSDNEVTVMRVQHRLRPHSDGTSLLALDFLLGDPRLAAFLQFYREHDGLELCRIYDARCRGERPLIDMKPGDSIAALTKRYQPGGDLAWTIDLNKSKALYRGTNSWIAFAQVEGGPACLTMFVNGEMAGCIFYLAPQPAFNILKPIAPSFAKLLDRIVKDLPKFLQLVRATVAVRKVDGENYGLVPVGYLPDSRED